MKVKLKDITSLITKGTTPTTLGFCFQSQGIKFVKVESFEADGTFIPSKTSYISEDCNEALKRSQLKENDILFSIAGAIGRVAVVTKGMLPCNTNQALAIIRIRDNRVYLPYIKLVLSSSYVSKQFNKLKQGVAQLNLSLTDVGNLEIPLPEYAEQESVSRNLEKLQTCISARRAQLSKLDELVKCRFVELFGDMIYNPNKWEKKALQSVADIVSGITKGRKISDTKLIEVPYMSVCNVKDGYIDWTNLKTILATNKEIEQYRILANDVLMTEGGDPDKVGRGAIISSPPSNCIHQNHIFRVRLSEEVEAIYFEQYLQQPKARQYFYRSAKQTTGIASINMSQLKAMPVLLPPLALQEQFADFVHRIDKLRFIVEDNLSFLSLVGAFCIVEVGIKASESMTHSLSTLICKIRTILSCFNHQIRTSFGPISHKIRTNLGRFDHILGT